MSGPRLLLVRHGITDWNREGRFQGHLDPPLAELGRLEAELLAARLAADPTLRPSRVVTSTLARARQTAEAIATACGAQLALDPRLIEIGQGEWEGRTHTELAIDDAERYAAWRDGDEEHLPPGGEEAAGVEARVAAVVADLVAATDGPICLVSHGGTLRLLARSLLELDPARTRALDLDNASLSVLRPLATGRWRLERWNDTLHLLGRVATHVDEAEGRPLAL